MSKVRLYGDTSGYVDLKAPDVANDVTITLPNETGPFATESYVDTEVAAAGGLVAVKQATQGGAVTLSIAAGSSADITGLSITHALSDAANKVLLFAYIGQMYASTAYAAQLAGFAVDGTLVGIADSAGNRRRAGVGGRSHYNTIDYPWTSPPLMYLYAPGDTSSHDYTLRGINGLSSGTQTLYINRNHSDTDTSTNPRTLSSIILQEVKV